MQERDATAPSFAKQDRDTVEAVTLERQGRTTAWRVIGYATR